MEWRLRLVSQEVGCVGCELVKLKHVQNSLLVRKGWKVRCVGRGSRVGMALSKC
jgi:hypothetical protein